MAETLMKYFGEQGPEHGGKLFWSRALGGMPFRGLSAPTLTRDELETQVGVQHDFHAELFDLSDEDQNTRYHWVMDRIVNNLFVHHFLDRKVDHATGKVSVYIEWSQRYAQLSPQAQAARSGAHYAIPPKPEVQDKFTGPNGLAGFQDPSSGL